MFNSIKARWKEAALVSAFEGVIRESSKGNALEVQTWYFKIKKEAYKQSVKEGVTAEEIENRALNSMAPSQVNIYIDIVARLSKNGGVLAEVNDWLKSNRPI